MVWDCVFASTGASVCGGSGCLERRPCDSPRSTSSSKTAYGFNLRHGSITSLAYRYTLLLYEIYRYVLSMVYSIMNKKHAECIHRCRFSGLLTFCKYSHFYQREEWSFPYTVDKLYTLNMYQEYPQAQFNSFRFYSKKHRGNCQRM